MSETICAIATAVGESGIGIVRMSGDRALEIARKVFRTPTGRDVKEFSHRHMCLGQIVDDKGMVDEVLLAAMLSPRTYTREDMVEIYTHGGRMAVKKVLAVLLEAGAKPAGPGEFTQRAFLNGRLDLSQAEAVMDLIRAKNEKAYDLSLQQLEGSLTQVIQKLRSQLTDILARIEYAINFDEEGEISLSLEPVRLGTQEVLESLKKLRDTKNRGRMIRDGIVTTILGKPNVGKSSLLNALLRENRAIVTDIPGTTRDVIEEWIELDGISLRINDTAGIRETKDPVESLGVLRSRELAERSDLILALFDGSRPLDEEDREILERTRGRRTIKILNKRDLNPVLHPKDLGEGPVLEMVIREGVGIEALEEAIAALFDQGPLPDSQVLLTNVRQEQIVKEAIASLEQALEALEAQVPMDCIEVDLKASWEKLGEITGETPNDEIMDRVFRDFCVGK